MVYVLYADSACHIALDCGNPGVRVDDCSYGGYGVVTSSIFLVTGRANKRQHYLWVFGAARGVAGFKRERGHLHAWRIYLLLSSFTGRC